MRGGREEEVYRVAFWNVMGLLNKDREFWKGLMDWDVMDLIKTWLESKIWESVKKWLIGMYNEQERRTRREEQWEG